MRDNRALQEMDASRLPPFADVALLTCIPGPRSPYRRRGERLSGAERIANERSWGSHRHGAGPNSRVPQSIPVHRSNDVLKSIPLPSGQTHAVGDRAP